MKQIRLKRKEMEKFPDFYKINCFNINTRSFKNTIDDLFQSLL